jgi:hypothetical protein
VSFPQLGQIGQYDAELRRGLRDKQLMLRPHASLISKTVELMKIFSMGAGKSLHKKMYLHVSDCADSQKTKNLRCQAGQASTMPKTCF